MKTIVSQIPDRISFLKGDNTLEIGYPWLTFGAIIALEGMINKNFKILEIGSGGSTVFWAKNCLSVKSYESSPEWHKKVADTLKNYPNVDLILKNAEETYNLIGLEKDGYYDLVLVDPDPKVIDRKRVAKTVISKIKPHGYLIIDNYLKFGMQDFSYPKGKIFTFDELRYSGMGTKICQLA